MATSRRKSSITSRSGAPSRASRARSTAPSHAAQKLRAARRQSVARGEQRRLEHLLPLRQRGEQPLAEAFVQPGQLLPKRADQAAAPPAVARHALGRHGQEVVELHRDRPALRTGAEAALQPAQEVGLVTVDHGLAEGVLAVEVVIEGALGHAGRAQHRVDAAGRPAAFQRRHDAGAHQALARAFAGRAAFGVAAAGGDGSVSGHGAQIRPIVYALQAPCREAPDLRPKCLNHKPFPLDPGGGGR